jgi:DNA-binding TFAR19-related protein (PDSD5 family)
VLVAVNQLIDKGHEIDDEHFKALLHQMTRRRSIRITRK